MVTAFVKHIQPVIKGLAKMTVTYEVESPGPRGQNLFFTLGPVVTNNDGLIGFYMIYMR